MGLCLRYSSEEVMKVSIVGLGWLGEPLAAHLLRRGLKVKGSTTTPEKIGKLSEKGIMAYPFFFWARNQRGTVGSRFSRQT